VHNRNGSKVNMRSQGADRRFPTSVFGSGEEPDARFTLANERTYLAWVRTALALIAGGVALEALGLELHPGLRLGASIVLIASGVVTTLFAWLGWMRVERSLRHGLPLPSSALGFPLAMVVAVVGFLVLLAVLLP